jgi:hypothetical protein
MSQYSTTLLAYLATRFGEPPEVLATLGLGYLLAQSKVCRDALAAVLGDWGVPTYPELLFDTEVISQEAEGRPDVVGADRNGVRHIILEGKFWAGLTENQPAKYLRSLRAGGSLVFVAPSRRVPSIWSEIDSRCGDDHMVVKDTASGDDFRVGRVDDERWLALLSWRLVLSRLHSALMTAGHTGFAGDVEQLNGLCERQDTDAFLPLASRDLATPTPMHVLNLMRLVDAIMEKGFETGLLQKHKFGRGWEVGKYTRYAAAGQFQVAVMFSLERWARERPTPLWIEFALVPGESLRSLEFERPPRVVYDGYHNRPVIPLDLLLHAERDAVIEDLCRQIEEVAELVRDCIPTVDVPVLPPENTRVG